LSGGHFANAVKKSVEKEGGKKKEKKDKGGMEADFLFDRMVRSALRSAGRGRKREEKGEESGAPEYVVPSIPVEEKRAAFRFSAKEKEGKGEGTGGACGIVRAVFLISFSENPGGGWGGGGGGRRVVVNASPIPASALLTLTRKEK